MSPGFSEALSSVWPVQLEPAYGAQVAEAHVGDYGVLYRRQPAVRTIVDFLAKNVAPLNIRAYRKTSGTPQDLPNHDAAALLQNPNPDMTRYELLHATMSARMTYENAFWWLWESGQARQIRFLPPEIVHVQGNPWIGPTGYRIMPNRMWGFDQEFYLSPDQVVHFKSWNPQDMRVGISKLEGLRSVLADDALAAQARAATWRNAAWVQNVVERPLDAPELTGDALKRHREDWQNQFGGSRNAGKTVFAEEGETMNWGPEHRPWDTEYVAGRKFTLEEVARSFHVPLSMVGLMSNANYKATSEERRTLYADVLDSELTMIEQELRGTYLRWFDDIEGVYFKFNIKEKLRGSFEEEAAILTQSAGRAWITANEARALQDLAPLPEGEGLVVPLNVSIGGQPNPATPTETPAGPLYGATQKALPKPNMVRRASVREHRAMLEAFFRRQEKVVMSRVGAKAAAFDPERWDRELALDLLPLALKTTKAAGKATALRHRGTYDEGRTLHYLEENARIAAGGINVVTAQQIDEAGDADALRNVFEVLLPARAVEIAESRATSLTSFATHEAAVQNDLNTKTWVVTSSKSRHPELGGETVGVYEPFSNGAQYPGDPSLGVDQTALCQCYLEVG
jgi:HK97 family phage portal protein